MTFVHVYAAHHTPMSTVLAHDPGLEGLTVHQIHETSEYELYDAFASSSRVSVESYHVRSLNSTSLSFCFQYVNYIDKFKDEMHDDLSTTFGLDFVVCEPWME
uniref:Uncharacterized protein n=2 Tax=Octactis speculum TaxID=3111310 RepID=A0A7S2GPR8_9STRA